MQAAPIMTDDMEDDVKPSDSVSNVGSRATRSRNSAIGGKSTAASTISSTRLKAEADLAALMARQKLLKDKHQLEEEEERLMKRKEQLQMDEEIAAHMAKLDVLRSQSILSGKTSITKRSDGMNSYLENGKLKPQALSADASSFIPQRTTKQKEIKHDYLDPRTRPKEKTAPWFTHSEPMSLHEPKQHSVYCDTQTQYGDALNANYGSGNEDQNNMLDIMRKQNEITTLLLQQQCLSSLPKREIPIFDGNPNF